MADEIPFQVSNKIFAVRGHRVILDADLATLYGVETRILNQSVKRNSNRFPEDFAFELTEKEIENLRCKIGTSKNENEKRGGRRYLPLVFTEQGVAMLSSVLKSEKAAFVNIEIMRAFVRFREFLLTNNELSRKLNELEGKYDYKFKIVFDAIRELTRIPDQPKKKIGIRQDD